MKFDLATSVIVAVVGTVIAFFVTNMFLPGIENFSFKVLGTAPSTTLTQPDPEVFNYRAINPTVEVYVGQCEEYGANGECVSTTPAPEGETNDDNTNDANGNGATSGGAMNDASEDLTPIEGEENGDTD